MNKKLILILTLIGIIFVSGCVKQTDSLNKCNLQTNEGCPTSSYCAQDPSGGTSCYTLPPQPTTTIPPIVTTTTLPEGFSPLPLAEGYGFTIPPSPEALALQAEICYDAQFTDCSPPKYPTGQINCITDRCWGDIEFTGNWQLNVGDYLKVIWTIGSTQKIDKYVITAPLPPTTTTIPPTTTTLISSSNVFDQWRAFSFPANSIHFSNFIPQNGTIIDIDEFNISGMSIQLSVKKEMAGEVRLYKHICNELSRTTSPYGRPPPTSFTSDVLSECRHGNNYYYTKLEIPLTCNANNICLGNDIMYRLPKDIMVYEWVMIHTDGTQEQAHLFYLLQ